MQVLARSPLTKDLSRDQHAKLDRHLSAWAWAAGDPVVLAGEQVSGSYLVASGRARITKDTVDGHDITLDIAAEGDVIGPLYAHPSPATHSAWAMETTCALFLPAAALADIIQEYPAIAVAIITMQQDELAEAQVREVTQATWSVDKRVAAVLLRLDAKLGDTRRDGSRLLQARLRRDDIAGMAGTTVESASRALAKMKKTGAIESGREWIAIVNFPALTALVSD